MAKCANCAADAVFEYRLATDLSTLFCATHLPRFLKSAAHSGNVHKVSSKAPVVEAPVVDEPVIEEPVVEEVAPKPSKKKTTPVVEEPAVVEEVPEVEEAAPSEE